MILTKCTIEELHELSKMLRALLPSYRVRDNKRNSFEPSTLRSIARALEPDCPYARTPEEKQVVFNGIINSDTFYGRYCTITKPTKYDTEGVALSKEFDSILGTEYKDLPLLVNNVSDFFTETILFWRLKVGK